MGSGDSEKRKGELAVPWAEVNIALFQHPVRSSEWTKPRQRQKEERSVPWWSSPPRQAYRTQQWDKENVWWGCQGDVTLGLHMLQRVRNNLEVGIESESCKGELKEAQRQEFAGNFVWERTTEKEWKQKSVWSRVATTFSTLDVWSELWCLWGDGGRQQSDLTADSPPQRAPWSEVDFGWDCGRKYVLIIVTWMH